MSKKLRKNYVHTPTAENFDFWIKNNYNVLFIGKHGVGKTSMIEDAFKRHNIKHRYFSASTMDPFVDFIGVPKEMKDEKGSYLELVKPKEFRDDEIEALFFDEFNRSPKKVRNAVMELIQFKSINGRKFPNLKMIWAAINPDDEDTATYDVEPIDPAQRDRFHIQIELPYKPSFGYFSEKFNDEIADSACDWWENLPEDAKNEVSPRRLDMALEIYTKGGNIRHVISPVANIEKLTYALKHGSPTKKFDKILKTKPFVKETMATFLSDENSFAAVKSNVIKHFEIVSECLAPEKVVSLVYEVKDISDAVFANPKKYQTSLESIADHGQNAKMRKQANDALLKSGLRVVSASSLVKTATTVLKAAEKMASDGVSINTSSDVYTTTHGDYTKTTYKPMVAESEFILKMEGATSIVQKSEILDSVCYQCHIKSSISYDDAEKYMGVIDWACSKMHSRTIASVGRVKLPVAVNKCVSVLCTKMKTEDIVRKYPNIFVKAFLEGGCGLATKQWIVKYAK